MKQFCFFFFFSTFILKIAAQPCTTVVVPQLSENTRKEFEQKLATAKTDHEKDTTNADAIIWYGRRTAYLGDYMKAIDIFSKGIALHPGDARLYRHRGHRYITVRCFDKAIDDFKKAAELVKGKPDEVEPDGLPNAKNIPTSTLQSNIWYHLGLAYFIKGDYKKALKAYEQCIKVSDNKDMYVATANWMSITLRKMKKYKEAIALYNSIPDGELIENKDYLLLLGMHTQKRTQQQVDEYATSMLPKDQSLGSATLNFGIGYYCLLYGYADKAKAYFNKAIATNQWSGFGFIAAEAELAKMK
jgi:tetratricopeptide (TPR) repeat protein